MPALGRVLPERLRKWAKLQALRPATRLAESGPRCRSGPGTHLCTRVPVCVGAWFQCAFQCRYRSACKISAASAQAWLTPTETWPTPGQRWPIPGQMWRKVDEVPNRSNSAQSWSIPDLNRPSSVGIGNILIESGPTLVDSGPELADSEASVAERGRGRSRFGRTRPEVGWLRINVGRFRSKSGHLIESGPKLTDSGRHLIGIGRVRSKFPAKCLIIPGPIQAATHGRT